MDMRYVILVFFIAIIILTLISIASPELPFQIDTTFGIVIIIFSLFTVSAVWFSRNKSYYPY